MAPDRILGKHPRFASYLILGCALVIFGLSIWVYLLSGRVSDGEAIRRAEAKSAKARAALGIRFANTLVDTSICIPLANIQDLLDGTTLSRTERVDREMAKSRYLNQLEELQSISPDVKGCDQ